MAYFQTFPAIEYDVFNENKPVIIKNIVRRAGINSKLKTTREVFIDYEVKDGETPEIIAHKIYDNENLHWIILLMNDICNPYYDWVLTSDEIEKLLVKRYGQGQQDATHHYVNQEGYIVDVSQTGAIPVTNREFEVAENEKKRVIKILDPTYASIAQDELAQIMRQ